MLNWMSRAALESIAQGGIGVSVDPLIQDATDEYSEALKALMYVLFIVSPCACALTLMLDAGLRCTTSVSSASRSLYRASAKLARRGSGDVFLRCCLIRAFRG